MKKTLSRRELLRTMAHGAAAFTLPGCLHPCRTAAGGDLPNIVIIFADDLGYGDLGCFGHPTIGTPHLDQMAVEGMKLTQFYSASSVCTPSRAALLTGRLPVRNGMCHSKHRVLFPNALGGLPADEITIARALKTKGYATTCIGKWHLGHLPPYLPTSHGFDSYFGIPYSNDMRPCPLMENEKIIEKPARQDNLTRRYTERAVRFIEQNKDHPFFLYFPHTFPHVPLFASEKFKDTSRRGIYGDVVQELDWSVGQITATLRRLRLEHNTLVVFTSDNGPWHHRGINGGSAGLLRGAKTTTWEGGMREPTIAWWPGTITPGTVNTELTSTLDLFPTCLQLAGVTLPNDRILDGYTLVPLLTGTGKCRRDIIFYYWGTMLYAVRKGPWKMHLVTSDHKQQNPPLLYQIEHDPSEKYNLASKHPDIIAEIKKEISRHQSSITPVPSQMDKFSK